MGIQFVTAQEVADQTLISAKGFSPLVSQYHNESIDALAHEMKVFRKLRKNIRQVGTITVDITHAVFVFSIHIIY